MGGRSLLGSEDEQRNKAPRVKTSTLIAREESEHEQRLTQKLPDAKRRRGMSSNRVVVPADKLSTRTFRSDNRMLLVSHCPTIYELQRAAHFESRFRRRGRPKPTCEAVYTGDKQVSSGPCHRPRFPNGANRLCCWPAWPKRGATTGTTLSIPQPRQT